MKYTPSDNCRHLVTKTITPLHYTSPNYNSLHITTFVGTSLLPIQTSPNYTSLTAHLPQMWSYKVACSAERTYTWSNAVFFSDINPYPANVENRVSS
jgi:hypothetical protein